LKCTGGHQAAHATTVAAALGFHGKVLTYDTAALGYMGSLIILDDADLAGNVRVQYKNWAKLSALTAGVAGPHPYRLNGFPVMTTGVIRNPKWYDKNPRLILHELSINEFTVVNT